MSVKNLELISNKLLKFLMNSSLKPYLNQDPVALSWGVFDSLFSGLRVLDEFAISALTEQQKRYLAHLLYDIAGEIRQLNEANPIARTLAAPGIIDQCSDTEIGRDLMKVLGSFADGVDLEVPDSSSCKWFK